MRLLIDLHRDGARQGPGSEEATRLAMALARLSPSEPLVVADIGCGTGASTLTLAKNLNAAITAVDFVPEFLERLRETAAQAGVGDQITTDARSMDNLAFAAGTLDVIWSEGAIYNIGFERGVTAWRPFLKPGGILAVSELTWFTPAPDEDLKRHWDAQYPEVGTASQKIAVLEASGYTPLGYFPLQPSSWFETYYRPLEARFDRFLAAHGNSHEAQVLVAAEVKEIALYERHHASVGYGFYIAQNRAERDVL